jgi:hypothetical protein
VIDDPDELVAKHIPGGWYGAILEDATVRNKPADDAYNPNREFVNWRFRIDDEDCPDEFNGRAVWQETFSDKGRGKEFLRFLIGCGVDVTQKPLTLDFEEMQGLEVKINISERPGKKKDPVTGERMIYNGITEVVANEE